MKQISNIFLLLDVGSQLLKNGIGNTPLDEAETYGHKEMQRLLESHFQLS